MNLLQGYCHVMPETISNPITYRYKIAVFNSTNTHSNRITFEKPLKGPWFPLVHKLTTLWAYSQTGHLYTTQPTESQT